MITDVSTCSAACTRVAAVDDERGLVGEDDGRAGRAGEAGQPGEALGALRHVFALMLVGARHDEAVEAAARQLLPQLGDALGTLGGRGGVVEKSGSGPWKAITGMGTEEADTLAHRAEKRPRFSLTGV